VNKIYYKNKVVLIVGGASGIGAGIAKTLSDFKATIIIADRDYKKASLLASEIGKQSTAEEVDVANPESVRCLFERCTVRHLKIDMLINCAGIVAVGDATEFTDKEWQHVMAINLMGTIYTSMSAFRLMQNHNAGQIVNFSSGAALTSSRINLPYATSKWGVMGFTLGLRNEGIEKNIKISVICPGYIHTSMNKSANQNLPFYIKPISVECAVKIILNGVEKNKAVIVFPLYQRVIWFLERTSLTISTFLRNSAPRP